MKIRMLNLLIILAVVLNVWYGWKVGMLYGPDLHTQAAMQIHASSFGSHCCSSDIPKTPNHDFHGTYEDELTELDRKIGDVVAQLKKMGLDEETVLMIHADGSRSVEYDNSMLSARFQ